MRMKINRNCRRFCVARSRRFADEVQQQHVRGDVVGWQAERTRLVTEEGRSERRPWNASAVGAPCAAPWPMHLPPLLRLLATKLPLPLPGQAAPYRPRAQEMAGQQMAYEDPNTPRHTNKNKRPLISLKRLILRKKQPPKSTIPLTVKNLEQFHNPDYTDVHDAFVRVRPQRKVSVHEWLQLLP
jgi:hypothetical protein